MLKCLGGRGAGGVGGGGGHFISLFSLQLVLPPDGHPLSCVFDPHFDLFKEIEVNNIQTEKPKLLLTLSH